MICAGQWIIVTLGKHCMFVLDIIDHYHLDKRESQNHIPLLFLQQWIGGNLEAVV